MRERESESVCILRERERDDGNSISRQIGWMRERRAFETEGVFKQNLSHSTFFDGGTK